MAFFVPTRIRRRRINLGQEDRAYIRRKLGRKLRKFMPFVRRTSVRLDDVNGPRGGVDQVCQIKVVLTGLPSVVFEMQSASLKAAVDGALSGVERAVRRSVQRRRMTNGRSEHHGSPL